MEITSPHYWVLPLSEEQEEKYHLIKKLKEEGYTYLQISDYLNKSHHKPQRTDSFTPQQVFGLYFKMNQRIRRLSNITPPRILDVGLQMIGIEN